MTIRTSTDTVTFKRPFVLGGFDEELSAGTYSVETDEELLDGLSFPAYRRILTMIRLHAKSGHPGLTRTLTIDPKELDAALKRDQAAAMPAEPDLDEMMMEPIVRLLMRRDGLSESEIRDVIKTARTRQAVLSR